MDGYTLAKLITIATAPLLKESMKTYLVSSYWRGALNIGDMRVFDNDVDAWAYYDSVSTSSWKRIYQTSHLEGPKLLKDKDRPIINV